MGSNLKGLGAGGVCWGAWTERPLRRGDEGTPICHEWKGKKGDMYDEKPPGIPQLTNRVLAPFWGVQAQPRRPGAHTCLPVLSSMVTTGPGSSEPRNVAGTNQDVL